MERARDFENQRATGGKVVAKLKEIGSRPAAALPEDAAILQYVRAVDAHLGIRSHLDCSSTDANIPLSLGIPAIAIGAGGIGRRRPHLPGMVPARRPRPGPEAHLSAPAAADARSRERHGERAVSRRAGAEAALVWNTWSGAPLSSWSRPRWTIFPRCPVPGAAVFAGHRGALLVLFRRGAGRGSPADPGNAHGRRSALPGTFLFSGYLFQTLGLRLTTAPKSAFITGLSVGDGTFAGGARL